MRLSQYFLPVTKEAPSEAAIVSHQLMLRAGMIRQSGAGIYSWLPLGFRVLKKIEQIVREEMNRAGAVEMLRSEEHTSELQSRSDLVCRLLLEKKNYHTKEHTCTKNEKLT